MNGIFYKRCGCTVAGGDGRSSAGASGRVERRQFGASCPRLKLPDGSWSPDHGTWYLQIDAPGDVPGRTIHLRHGGYATRQDAEQQAAVVRALLATAQDAAEPTLARVEIARAIRALLASGDRLPSPLAVTDRIRNGQPPVPPTVAGWLREWLGAKTTSALLRA